MYPLQLTSMLMSLVNKARGALSRGVLWSACSEINVGVDSEYRLCSSTVGCIDNAMHVLYPESLLYCLCGHFRALDHLHTQYDAFFPARYRAGATYKWRDQLRSCAWTPSVYTWAKTVLWVWVVLKLVILTYNCLGACCLTYGILKVLNLLSFLIVPLSYLVYCISYALCTKHP